jgi:hypothetical protein
MDHKEPCPRDTCIISHYLYNRIGSMLVFLGDIFAERFILLGRRNGHTGPQKEHALRIYSLTTAAHQSASL